MWCWMSDFYNCYAKCMNTEINRLSVPWTRFFFPSYWMMYWKISWFVHNFLQNYHLVPKVYDLTRNYLQFLGYLIFYILSPIRALEALRVRIFHWVPHSDYTSEHICTELHWHFFRIKEDNHTTKLMFHAPARLFPLAGAADCRRYSPNI